MNRIQHVQTAHHISVLSSGAILMSAFSLPEMQPKLEEIVELFDDWEYAEYGQWIVSVIKDIDNPREAPLPVAVIVGEYADAVRTAFCLQPVASMYNKHRQRVTGYVRFHKLGVMSDRTSPFMSFPEFVASRRESVDYLNSQWTGEPNDDEDHVKGFFYGTDNHRILLTENEHTDMVGLVYMDFGYAEENQTELEALAYRCYLNSIGVLSDDELRPFFKAPFPNSTRRETLTY